MGILSIKNKFRTLLSPTSCRHVVCYINQVSCWEVNEFPNLTEINQDNLTRTASQLNLLIAR